MRVTLLSVPMALLFLTACAPSTAELSEERERAVRAEVTVLAGQLLDAMNAGDAEAVLSFYTEGPDFTYLGCTDYINGGANFRQVVSPYYRPGREPGFEQRVVASQVLGPTGVVLSLRGSSKEAPNLFWTQVWRRNAEGAWHITYEHESWPGCSEPSAPHPMTEGADTLALVGEAEGS